MGCCLLADYLDDVVYTMKIPITLLRLAFLAIIVVGCAGKEPLPSDITGDWKTVRQKTTYTVDNGDRSTIHDITLGGLTFEAGGTGILKDVDGDTYAFDWVLSADGERISTCDSPTSCIDYTVLKWNKNKLVLMIQDDNGMVEVEAEYTFERQ